jgi:hypothetical protein
MRTFPEGDEKICKFEKVFGRALNGAVAVFSNQTRRLRRQAFSYGRAVWALWRISLVPSSATIKGDVAAFLVPISKMKRPLIEAAA